MKKVKLRALAIVILSIFITSQVAFANVSNTKSNAKAPNNTIFYSDRNGVTQYFLRNADGVIIPDTNNSILNPVSKDSKVINIVPKQKLITKNLKKGAMKNILINQKKTVQVNSKPLNTSGNLDKYSKNKLKNKLLSVPGELLVKYKDTALQTAKSTVLSKNNLKSKGNIKSKNIELVTLPKNANADSITQILKSDPNVASVQPNYIYQKQDLAPNDPMFNQLWGLENYGQSIAGASGLSDVDIDILNAWDTTKGDSNLVIGVIDTGIDMKHPDLQGKIWTNPGEIAGDGIDNDGNGYIDDVNGWDFYNGDNTIFDWEDVDAHGTHVSGTIAASMDSTGVVGIAPNVKIMPLKFLGPHGGSTFDAICAIEYAKAMGVKILNNSWGGGGYDVDLKDAIAASGALFVAAAGNEYSDTDLYPTYPASFDCDNIISVAAIDNQGRKPNFSNWGLNSVDVAAPGELILSSVPKKAPFGAGILSSNTLFHGFGLEILNTDADRKVFMQKALSSLGITSTTSKILLIQDDASNIPGRLNCLSSYKTPLTALGYNSDVITVSSGTDGPSAILLKNYDLVIWFTGNDYFPITVADQANLISFLDSGKKLYLSGSDAGWGIEYTDFYTKYLHAYFIEEDYRSAIYGEANTPFAGDTYTLIPSPYLDYLKPSDPLGKIVLSYVPEVDYTDAYEYWGGTSMATPHVAGIAALLLSKSPTQDPIVIKRKIMKGVDPFPVGTGLGCVAGGIVNAAKALALPDIAVDDDIPGVSIKETITSTLDQNKDLDDVYNVKLNAGETVTLNLQGLPGENTDFDLHLYAPNSTTVNDAVGILESSEHPDTSDETIKYTALVTGIYYVDVYAYAGVGSYTLTKTSELILDDSNTQLNYSGNWTLNTNAGNEGGTAKVLNSPGKVLLPFAGSSVKWTGFKDPQQGIARVLIDGKVEGEINLYSSIRRDQQVLFEKAFSFGPHILEIQWTGLWDKHDRVRKTDTAINVDTIKINTAKTKAFSPTIIESTGYAGSNMIMFQNNDNSPLKFNIYRATDGTNFTKIMYFNYYPTQYNQQYRFYDFDVTNDVTYTYYVTAVNDIGESLPSNTVNLNKIPTNSDYLVEDTSAQMTYAGTWTEESGAAYSGGKRHITVEPGAKVTIPFTGYSSRITLLTGPDMGMARVYWPGGNGNYMDANLNYNFVGPWNFGMDSTNRFIGLNWVIECVSGKINIDVENIWDFTTTAPSAPLSLAGSISNSTVSLNWNPNSELDLKGYNVYRSTTSGAGYALLNTAPLTNTQFTDNTILPGQSYYYIIKAINYANLESSSSNEVTFKQVIAVPTGLTGTLSGTNVLLNWAQSTDPNVTQYKIYRSTTISSNYALLNTVTKPAITYTDTTAVAGTTYYYEISAAASNGAESAMSTPVTVIVPQSITAPTGFTGALSTTGTAVSLNWTRHTDTNVTQYKIYRSTTSGTFTTPLTTITNPATTTYTDSTVAAGTTYYYVITAVSGTGVESVISNQVAIVVPASGETVIKIEENNPLIKFTGTFSSHPDIRNSAGNGKFSNITGDSFEMTFTGTGIRWIGYASKTKGIAKITLDGVSQTLDAYSSTEQFQKVFFENTNLASGTHTIKIEVTGTKNTNATGTYIHIDRLDIITKPVTNIEENNPLIKFTGTFSSHPDIRNSAGNAKFSNITGDSFQMIFTGTGIRWIGYASKTKGIAKITLDGVSQTLDAYSSTEQFQKVFFENTNLSLDKHTIKIEVTGTKNTNATGTYIHIDRLDVIN